VSVLFFEFPAAMKFAASGDLSIPLPEGHFTPADRGLALLVQVRATPSHCSSENAKGADDQSSGEGQSSWPS